MLNKPTTVTLYSRNKSYQYTATYDDVRNKNGQDPPQVEQKPGRVIKKHVDGRYNCFGLCFASGLAWVGGTELLPCTILSILQGSEDPASDFDARKLLEANGLKLIGSGRVSNGLPYYDRLIEGDLVLYSRSQATSPNHVGVFVGLAKLESAVIDIRVLSKLGSGAEVVHSWNDDLATGQGDYVEVYGDR